MSQTTNRVEAMIAKFSKQIEDRKNQGLVTQQQIDKLNKDLDMPLDLYADFQNRKSVAMLEGLLSADEAQTIYAYLGESPETFNGQNIGVKSVLTKIHQELIEKAMKRRGIAVPN